MPESFPLLPMPVLASVAENISLVFLGFGIVLSILGVLWLATTLIGRYFIAQAAREQAAIPEATVSAPRLHADPSSPVDVSADPRLVAVVAAAAQLALDRPVAIRSITPAARGTWAAEGRRAIHTSHRVR